MIFQALSDTLGYTFQYQPALFVLYTVLIFLAAALVCAIIAYIIACCVNKGTQMTAPMQVSVALNAWAEEGDHSHTPLLNYGTYRIRMQDPPEIKRDRIDPELNWFEKALPRQYSVGILLCRFQQAFNRAGFSADASNGLLEWLMKDDIFLASLGRVSRASKKRGMTHDGVAQQKKTGLDSVCVYLDLPDGAVGYFKEKTGCTIENMRITLDYCQGEK